MSRMGDELSEMKAQFLATLNHEIRTPLSGVLGMLDLLSETDMSPEQREYAESCRICAQNLLEIMNATLDYSALSAGLVSPEVAEFPVREMLDRLVEEFDLKAKAKGLQLIRNFHQGLPDLVIGDAVLIKQMLGTLIENAVKFTNHGKVEVSADSISLDGADALLTISILDTGVGITQDQLKIVFDPFRQGESGLARRYSGMGLGLAVTQELAKLMKAHLSVASVPGEGSNFSVEIPVVTTNMPTGNEIGVLG